MFVTGRSVQLKNLKIIESSFEFIDPDSDTEDFLDFEDYDINVEHGINWEKDVLFLTLSIAVNWDDDTVPGYSMHALGVMSFTIFNNGAKDENSANESNVSEAVNMGIGAIRGYLTNISALGLMGPFILPNIDLDIFTEGDAGNTKGVRNLNPDRP